MSILWPQILCFEYTRKCNRACEHHACPSGDLDRYGNLPQNRILHPQDILTCLDHAYAHDFRGFVGFHHYNEPLLAWDRTRHLIHKIRDRHPRSKFLLWTNGDLIRRPNDNRPQSIDPEELRVFALCYVSNYANISWSFLNRYIRQVLVLDGKLDRRKTPALPNQQRCFRPFIELVIDHYGNGKLCCADWKGTVKLGNIFTNGFPAIVTEHLRLRELIAQQPLPEDVPSVCLTCPIRSPILGTIDAEIATAQQRYLHEKLV